MKLEEARSFRKIEAFCHFDYDSPMRQSEMADAFCYIVPAIQTEIVDCACKYSFNKNSDEWKIALDRIAALVSDYRFKTETGIQVAKANS